MAISTQNYKSSDFLTATSMLVASDGTLIYFWDDHSVSVTQVDEMEQEHTVLLNDSMLTSGFLFELLKHPEKVVVF